MRLALATAATAAALLVPAAASQAATICVDLPGDPSCSANHDTVQAAMNAANSNGASRDTVKIGPGLHEQPQISQGPTPDDRPVDVVGSGQGDGGTRLRSTTSSAAIALYNATISNLRVEIPGNKGSPAAGLDLFRNAHASNVTIVSQPSGLAATGVLMRETASLKNATIDLSAAGGTSYGVSIDSTGTHEVENVAFNSLGLVASRGNSSGATVRRIRSVGRCNACIYALKGNVELSDSLLLPVTDADVVTAQPGATVNARNITIVGDGSGANTSGFRANGSGVVNVLDSIILGVQFAIYTDGQGKVSIDYSDFDPQKVQQVGVAGLFTFGSHNVNVDPKFVNPAGGDFHLASGSPVADRASPGNGATAFDLDGAPRLADANGDGQAVLDMGAFEYAGAAYELPPVENHGGPGTGGGGGGGGPLLGPQMTIQGKTATLDSKRRVKVKLLCPNSETGSCTGTLKLVTAKKVRPKPGKKAVYVTLGTGKFTAVPGGMTKTVTIKLSKTNAALVRRLKKVKTTATIVARWQVGDPRTITGSLTVKPAARKK